MAIREARWDCQTCGTTGIQGRHKACTNCGQSRPEGTRFYLPEEAAEVEDDALLKLAKSGADWLCSYCGASNTGTMEVCGQCGATQEDSAKQAVKEYGLGDVRERATTRLRHAGQRL